MPARLVRRRGPDRADAEQHGDGRRRDQRREREPAAADPQALPGEQREQPAERAADQRPQRGARDGIAHHVVDLRAGAPQQHVVPRGGAAHRFAVRRARLELDPHGRLEHARAHAPVGQRHVDLDARSAEARQRDARTDAAEVRLVDVRAREAQAHQPADHAGRDRDHGEQGVAGSERARQRSSL